MYSIYLQAINPEKNVYRDYQIEVINDLLGDLVIDVRWGRIGYINHHRILLAQDLEDARYQVYKLFKKRKGATKRIGVPYKIKRISGSLIH